MLAILRQRNFALLWFGGLISMTGDWLLRIGLPVYVYSLTGSALATSIMLITGFVPDVLLDAVSFLFVCSMLSLMRLPAPLVKAEHAPAHVVREEKNLLREWLEGLQLIFRLQPLTILFLMLAVQSVGEGVFSVLLVVFVEKVLGYGAAVYGSLGSMQAVGSLLGGAIIGLLGKRYAPARLVGICTCLFGIIDLL